MVIYGYLEAGGTSMQPEFYLLPEAFNGAEEESGAFHLGTPIRSDAPAGSSAVAISLRQKLQARTTAVTDFVAGLTGLVTKDYARSEKRFQLALDNTSWDDRDGKEVVYLFRGTAATLVGKLDVAERAYRRSLELNPEYGRAMIGLAQVELLQASRHCVQGTADAAGLVAARDQYRAALLAKDRPPRSHVPAKAHFGIAQVDVCLSQALAEDAWADAEGELTKVISEFDAGSDIADLAAEAHALLAVVRLPSASDSRAHERYVDAAAEYAQAVKLSVQPN